jgi:hypothetical protein
MYSPGVRQPAGAQGKSSEQDAHVCEQSVTQALSNAPCFISQPARSGLCQNSTPSLSGFLPLNRLAMLLLLLLLLR